jgi:hypothetical protein
MRWTPNGEKICIVYVDGAVIVGSVDGNRLWGKELNLNLSKVEWSAEGRFILFATSSGDCHVYDSNGNGVAKVPLYCNDGYTGRQGTSVDTAGAKAAAEGSSSSRRHHYAALDTHARICCSRWWIVQQGWTDFAHLRRGTLIEIVLGWYTGTCMQNMHQQARACVLSAGDGSREDSCCHAGLDWLLVGGSDESFCLLHFPYTQ